MRGTSQLDRASLLILSVWQLRLTSRLNSKTGETSSWMAGMLDQTTAACTHLAGHRNSTDGQGS